MVKRECKKWKQLYIDIKQVQLTELHQYQIPRRDKKARDAIWASNKIEKTILIEVKPNYSLNIKID